jgi:uncharacterized protein (DUF2141 family)
MKRIAFAFALAMVVFATRMAFAQDKCTVSGEVVYSGDAVIHVLLLNATTFPANVGRDKALPPPEFVQMLKVNAAGKASFAFINVPKGEYVVRVYADKNNNGKFDTDAWGFPLEPISAHKMPKNDFTNWNEQKFVADKDVTDIVVKLGS